MKKNLIFGLLLCPMVLATLVGCQQKEYPISDYILTYDMGNKSELNVLQISDLHIGAKDERERQKDLIQRVVLNSDCDFFVITGDVFTFADKYTAKEMLTFFDSLGMPWTLTWGNHDEQCYFSVDWISSYLEELSKKQGSNLYFRDFRNDNVYGNANFAINVMKEGKLFEQLIIMDSNRYNFLTPKYDYIKPDQIQWYKDLVNYTKNKFNDGKIYDSLLYFHIPLPEWRNGMAKFDGHLDQNGAIEEAYIQTPIYLHTKKGFTTQKVKQYQLEGCGAPNYNSGFFDVIKQTGSSKAISCGHEHINNFILDYEGVYLCYGVNTSDRIYFTEKLVGGRIIKVNSNHGLTFYDHYEEYNKNI